MNWIYYILEANLYLVVFYLMYKLLLQGTTFYSANRYFLVCSIAAAFTIPLLQLGFLKPQALITTELEYYDIPLETLEIETIETQSALTIENYVVYTYIALSVCLGLKFLLAIAKITKLYFANRKHKSAKYTLVELPTEQSAFSFFNVLFIHPSMAKNDAILTHEKIHIREKHSFDIILLELLKIICWFNPIVYFIKNDLRLLHEYIADENTTAATISKHEYAMFLIENSIGAFSPSLVNQFFNQSILKSRINMLNKEKTANWARLKYLLAVPLGGALLCVSTLAFSKSYGYVDLFSGRVNSEQASQKVIDEVQMAKDGRYSPSYVFDDNGVYKSLEKRLIVINGVAIKDNNKYYGSNNADKILFLKAKDAITKYGTRGKHGVVEIYGRKSVLTYQPPYVIADTAKFPAPKMQASETPNLSPKPPKAKRDQVKFPPPRVEKQPARFLPENQTAFYPRNGYKNKKLTQVDKRHIVINGLAVEDNGKFYGVTNADKIVILNPDEATKVYGAKKGRYGAVQISGNVKATGLVEPPPSLYKSPIEIDRTKGDLLSFSKISEIKALTVYDRWGKVIYNNSNYNDDWNTKKGNYDNYDGKELASGTYYYFLKVNEAPEKSMRGSFFIKVQGLKVTPNDNLSKTVAIKKITSGSATGKSEVTTAKSTFEKANNAFIKAWTFYKPKVQENSNEGC